MDNLLLHVCCAYCATYAVEYWRGQGKEVTALWYNPNIHPFLEHQRRLEAVQQLSEKRQIALMISPGYEVDEYFKAIRQVEKVRCEGCFHIRLGKAARVAKEKGFAAFTTTLSISPHQKLKLLRKVGEAEGMEKGVPFLYVDLRSGYRESHRIGHELGLYHQRYCGCMFSEWERYCRTKR